MRLGWWERYESRGSRTVLREAGVKFLGLLTIQTFKKLNEREEYIILDLKGNELKDQILMILFLRFFVCLQKNH